MIHYDIEIQLKDEGNRYVDSRNNSWRKEAYSREDAMMHSSKMDSCYDCEDCENCAFSIKCIKCKNCTWCHECKECHECSGCEGMENINHKMQGPPGSFFYLSPITRKVFGYYWDNNNNIWDVKLYTLAQAVRIAETMTKSGKRNPSKEIPFSRKLMEQ